MDDSRVFMCVAVWKCAFVCVFSVTADSFETFWDQSWRQKNSNLQESSKRLERKQKLEKELFQMRFEQLSKGLNSRGKAGTCGVRCVSWSAWPTLIMCFFWREKRWEKYSLIKVVEIQGNPEGYTSSSRRKALCSRVFFCQVDVEKLRGLLLSSLQVMESMSFLAFGVALSKESFQIIDS